MESAKIEDYLKAIYQVCAAQTVEAAATGDLAERLRVTPGSVTTMLQRLSDAGLVKYQSHRGAKLTSSGRKLALNVLRRHRLMELFLVKTLGLTWDEIHAEAENLEHAVSERLIDRIDELLGFPERDPHGDPIPNSDGTLRTHIGEPLANCAVETCFVLERVLDQTPEFLRYLSEGGLEPGSAGKLIETHPSVGIMTVEVASKRLSLSAEAAQNMLVRRVPAT